MTLTPDTIEWGMFVAECAHAGARYIDKYSMTFADGPDPNFPQARLLFVGDDEIGGDGYDWMDDLTESFDVRCNPNFGEWPLVCIRISTYDPKHNPPHTDEVMLRQFVTLTLCRIEGELFLAFYDTAGEAKADAHRLTPEHLQ